jgi:lipoate-protein ligase A
MEFLDRSLPSPAENLALDEALLDSRESGECEGSILRFWETQTPFVALGYVCKWREETNVEECEKCGVPILRRASGGGTVLQAPGVLNYALILPIENGTPTENLTETNRFVMEKNRAALQSLLSGEVSVRGITDLALNNRKFCGNAQRRRQRYLLFHGAFLLDCDLELMSAVLRPPPRQPDYRANRAHSDFVINLNLPSADIKAALRKEWNADETLNLWPQDKTQTLVKEKYRRAEWNEKF